MADETNTPTAAPVAQDSAPPTPAPEAGNAVPELYSNYLDKQDHVQPIIQLPLAEKIKLFDAVKPKDAGDKLSLGVAKTYLNKQKEVVHAPDKALGNRILKQNADVLNDMGKDYNVIIPPEELTPTQKTDIADRTKEFNSQLQKIYDIPASSIKEGTILPIPKGWNSPELKKIKFSQVNWSGEYIQLRKDAKTGELSWQGYNKPTAGSQELSPVKVIADTTGKKWDGKKWVIHEPDEKDVKTYWNKEYNSPDVSDGAIRLSGVLQSEQKEGNYRLTKLMQDNPELAKTYKTELETAAPESVSTAGGNITLLQSAVKKTYDLDKEISDVQKSFSQYQFNLAIDAKEQFLDFASVYDKQQDALAAKIATVSDAMLRKTGKGKDIDAMFQLRAQMMRNPESLTPQEKQRYYDLSMSIMKEASKIPESAPFIQQFNKNLDDYKTAYTKSVQESALLSTPDGKKALDLLQKQAVGINLYNNVLNYFPKAKLEAEKQAKIDQMQSDKTSMFKSLMRGMNTSFEDLSKGREQWAQWLGIMSPDDVIHEQRDIVPKYDNLTNKLYTPARPEQDDKGKTLWGNKISNFMDGTMEFTGSMTPYLISGGAGAASIVPETGMFFTSGYNDYYREGKEQGLNNNDAAIRAMLGGTTLALTQLFLPKAQLVQRKAINAELDNLLRQSARPDANALATFFSRFVNPEVFKATYKGGLAVFSNDIAQNMTNEYYNAAKGTHFKTETDMGKMVEQSLMFGVMASMTNGLFKGSNKTEQLGARNAMLAHAEKYPVESLRAIDDAITLSFTDSHYDRQKLLEIKTDIADMHHMQFPKEFTQDQKVATWALKKQKLEWKEDMGKLHEAERGIYENKLEVIDGQIREIASDPLKATEYLNSTAEPLYRRLEKQGYFDTEDKQGDFVMARHGQTDANFKGLINSDSEPLNAQGVTQAHELGQQLKEQGYKDVMFSPHTRSAQTAGGVVSVTGGRKIENSDLREWNRGEGADADFDYKHYVENPDEKPGNGESFNEFLGRIQKVRGVAIPDKTAVITHGQVMKLWESLDKSGGKWDEAAKTEFLKDSNDFENAEIYKPKVLEDKGGEPVKEGKKEQPKGATMADIKRQDAKKVYASMKGIDEPTDARGLALSYIAGGGKIGEGEIKSEITGSKDERIRITKKGKGQEVTGRDYLDKNGKTIKEVAHSIWDNLPEHLQDKISDQDVRDALIDVISSHNTRLDAAKEFIDSYHPDKIAERAMSDDDFEHFQKQYADEIAAEEKAIEDWLSDKGNEEFELSQSPEYIEHLIKQYEKESEGADKQSSSESEKETDKKAGNRKRSPTVEQQAVTKQLEDATAELSAARTAFDTKRKELDKGLVADQEDLFGDRKSKKEGTLFDERASTAARDKAMEPYKERVEKAKKEVERLQAKAKDLEGKESAQTDMFDKEDKEDKKAAIDKDIENSPDSEKPYHDQRKALVDKYGKDIDEMIEDLKKEDRLKVDCPPGTKRRFSLRNLIKT